jgi:hypothetical protein
VTDSFPTDIELGHLEYDVVAMVDHQLRSNVRALIRAARDRNRLAAELERVTKELDEAKSGERYWRMRFVELNGEAED